MDDERAALLLQGLPEDVEYLLRIKFMWERDEGDWVAEDCPHQSRTSKGTACRRNFTGDETGRTHGYRQALLRERLPLTAVVYVLKLAPLRDGDLNCVAQQVVKHFENATGGQGLTAALMRAIQAWEQRVHETGAAIEDVAVLENILKRAIIIRDIAGEGIFNSGKYQSRGGKVELIVHNGHAWGKDVHFPAARQVEYYEGNIWENIQKATAGDPKAVWVLEGGDDKKLNPEYVSQFVLVDGRVFRPREKHLEITEACRKYVAADRAEELAPKIFSEAGAAARIAREYNGWKPTPRPLLEDVQRACVEFGHGGLWCSPEGYNAQDVVSLDMVACYPGVFKGKGDCAPYFRRFGHPTHRLVRVAINDWICPAH